jgi:hypothetical protein
MKKKEESEGVKEESVGVKEERMLDVDEKKKKKKKRGEEEVVFVCEVVPLSRRMTR